MGIAPLGQTIRLPDVARAAAGLKAGDVVSLSVIKSITSGVWAIGIRGTVFRARSELALVSGERYAAAVVKTARGFELKLADPAALTPAAALKAAGFAGDPLTLLIVSSLMKQNVKLDAADVRTLRQVLERLKGDAKRLARVLGMLVAKGIRPDSPGLEELAAGIAGGEEGGGEREGDRRHPPPRREPEKQPEEEPARALKRMVAASAGRLPGVTAVSNHLTSVSGGEDWVIIPYRMTMEGLPLEGTLRFLYDRFANKIKRTVVVATNEDGRRFQFILIPQENGYRLSVTSSDARWQGLKAEHWPSTAARLAAVGVVWDSGIGHDAACDGFGPEEEAPVYRSIDTEG